MAIPVQLEIFMKDLTKAGLQSVGKNVDDVENQTLQLISALEKVRAEQIKQLEANKQAGADYAKEAANVQALTGQINGLTEGLKELNRTQNESGNTPLNIDTEDITKKTNNLRFQFQQVARELPSLAMGPQMFILAISNNLPMLADAISDVRRQNEMLAASGQKSVPLWKQLASSIFSWQTALVAAISLGIVYAKDITEWVKSITKGKDAALSLADAQKKVNESFDKDSGDVGEQAVRIKSLSTQWKDLGDNLEGKKRFIKENKDELDKLGVSVSNVNDAENLLAKNTEQYIQAMSLRAQAASAFKLATEAAETAIKKQVQINQEEKKSPSFMDRFLSVFSATGASTTVTSRSTQEATAEERQQSRIEGMKEEKKAAEETEKAYTELFTTLSNQAKKVLNDAGISENDNKEETKSTKTDYATQLADARVKAQQTTEKLRLQIMLEGIAKRKALAKQEYDNTISDIDKQERDTLAKMDKARKQGDNIPQNQYDDVKNTANTNRLLAKEIYNKKLLQIDNDYYSQAEKDMLEYDKKYGSYQDKQLAIIKEYYNKIAEATTDGRKKYLQKELEGLLLELQKEEKKAALTQDNNFLKMLFGDVSQMAFSDLSNLIAQARQLRDYLSGNGDKNGITFISTEQLKAIEESPEELDKLKKALDKLLDSGKKSHLEEIFDTFRKGFADLQSAKGFKDISGAIGTISGAAGDAAGMISEMFDAMGNTAVADALGEVQQVMNAVSNIGQGFAKGGIVGGIAAAIGEAANFIGQAFSANQRHKEALKQVMNEAIAQQREYNLLLMQQNLLYEEATTIFGTDSYAKAANSVNVMKDAISELNEALKGTSEQQEKQNTKPILGRMLNGVTGYYSELKSLYAGLADVDIKTGHKKRVFLVGVKVKIFTVLF